MFRQLCTSCHKNLAKKRIRANGRIIYTKECNTCRRARYRKEGPRVTHPNYPIQLINNPTLLADRLRHKTLTQRANGKTKKNAKYRKYLKNSCERCSFIPEDLCQLQIHHRDHNHANNAPSNLQTLCANCHILHHKKSSKINVL